MDKDCQCGAIVLDFFNSLNDEQKSIRENKDYYSKDDKFFFAKGWGFKPTPITILGADDKPFKKEEIERLLKMDIPDIPQTPDFLQMIEDVGKYCHIDTTEDNNSLRKELIRYGNDELSDIELADIMLDISSSIGHKLFECAELVDKMVVENG